MVMTASVLDAPIPIMILVLSSIHEKERVFAEYKITIRRRMFTVPFVVSSITMVISSHQTP
jgi:hypothetical protein